MPAFTTFQNLRSCLIRASMKGLFQRQAQTRRQTVSQEDDGAADLGGDGGADPATEIDKGQESSNGACQKNLMAAVQDSGNAFRYLWSVIELRDVSQIFDSPSGESRAVLENLSCAFEAGLSIAIEGPSDSGKSTLFGLSAGPDQPTSGEVIVAGHVLGKLN